MEIEREREKEKIEKEGGKVGYYTTVSCETFLLEMTMKDNENVIFGEGNGLSHR